MEQTPVSTRSRVGSDTWRTALTAANAAPRCGARCRTRGHAPCRNPAMPNGRCRMHGGKSTGARTEVGRERCRRARYIHGARSAEWVGMRKLTMVVIRGTRRLEALVRLEMARREAQAAEAARAREAESAGLKSGRGPTPLPKSDVAPHAPGNPRGNRITTETQRSKKFSVSLWFNSVRPTSGRAVERVSRLWNTFRAGAPPVRGEGAGL